MRLDGFVNNATVGGKDSLNHAVVALEGGRRAADVE